MYIGHDKSLYVPRPLHPHPQLPWTPTTRNTLRVSEENLHATFLTWSVHHLISHMTTHMTTHIILLDCSC